MQTTARPMTEITAMPYYERLLYGVHDVFDSTSPPSQTSFFNCALEWLSLFKLDTIKNSTFTYACFNPLRTHILPFFADIEVSEINSSHIQLYFKCKRDSLSLETLLKHKQCLRGIFELAIDNNIITRNPVSPRIKVTSTIAKVEKHVWTKEQYNAVWEYARLHPHGFDIITIMETAITRSELLGLTWRDYNPTKSSINIRNGLVSAKNPLTGKNELIHSGVKNTHRKREIPISKELNSYFALRQYETLQNGRKSNFIFASPKGYAYYPENWYRHVLKGFMRDMHEAYPDIPILTTHELRHTRATHLVNQDINLFAVAELMGHADLKMLRQRYVHHDLESMRAALQII